VNPLDSRLRGNDEKTKDKDRTSGSRLAACSAGLGRDDDPASLKLALGLGFGQVGPVEADNAGDRLDKGLAQRVGV